MLIQNRYRNILIIDLSTILLPLKGTNGMRYSKARSKQTDKICIDGGMAYDKAWDSQCVEIDSYPLHEIFLHHVCQHDKSSLNTLKHNDKCIY